MISFLKRFRFMQEVTKNVIYADGSVTKQVWVQQPEFKLKSCTLVKNSVDTPVYVVDPEAQAAATKGPLALLEYQLRKASKK